MTAWCMTHDAPLASAHALAYGTACEEGTTMTNDTTTSAEREARSLEQCDHGNYSHGISPRNSGTPLACPYNPKEAIR